MPRIRECHDDLFEGEISSKVIGTFHAVYDALGYGFPESVYRQALAIELTRRGYHVAIDVPVEVRYDGQVVGVFRAAMLVESRIVLELKATQKLTRADELQVFNYLRATELETGLLLHFGRRPGFRRLVATRSARDRSTSRSSAPLPSPSGLDRRRTGPRTISPYPPEATVPFPGAPHPPSKPFTRSAIWPAEGTTASSSTG